MTLRRGDRPTDGQSPAGRPLPSSDVGPDTPDRVDRELRRMAVLHRRAIAARRPVRHGRPDARLVARARARRSG